MTQEFWVDLYVDPNPVPASVNNAWDDGRSAALEDHEVNGGEYYRANRQEQLALSSSRTITALFGAGMLGWD